MEDEAADCLRRFECMTGVEIAVHGDDSRILLARRVIEQHDEISRKAIRLLESFMRDSGTFDLSSIEVFPARTTKDGDFALMFTFIADGDPNEYGYTHFEVFFFCHEPPQEPFWPFKFTVAFY